MARKQKQHKVEKEFRGLRGWEIKYLKQSIKYGHLEAPTKRKR
jgi:hypothetical protein